MYGAQLGCVSSPQLIQTKLTHAERFVSSVTLDSVKLTGITIILGRGLPEVSCSCSPTKPGTPCEHAANHWPGRTYQIHPAGLAGITKRSHWHSGNFSAHQRVWVEKGIP